MDCKASTASRPRRLCAAALVGSVCALALGAGAGGAQAAQPGSAIVQPLPPAPGGVAATLEQCVTSVDQAERSVTFTGEMVAVAGAARMAIRIDLEERLPGEGEYHAVQLLGPRRMAPFGPEGQGLQVPAPGQQPLLAGGLPWPRALPLAEREGSRDQARGAAHGQMPAAGRAGGSAGDERRRRAAEPDDAARGWKRLSDDARRPLRGIACPTARSAAACSRLALE